MTVAPALELRGLSKTFQLRQSGGFWPRYTDHMAVQDVNLTLPANSILGLVGAWLLVKRQAHAAVSGTPVLAATSPLDWKAVAMCAAAVLVYGALFRTLGFWLATTLMAVPVGMAFGGTLKKSLIGGLVMGLGFYVLFDKLLDVILPTGVLSFLLGGR